MPDGDQTRGLPAGKPYIINRCDSFDAANSGVTDLPEMGRMVQYGTTKSQMSNGTGNQDLILDSVALVSTAWD